jgi:GNAT superfamily N-acetyltransferase
MTSAAGIVGLTRSRHAIVRLSSDDEAKIDLVAHRMRLTLIEVKGEEAGAALYTLDWLRDRVRWHLDRSACTGEVFLAERSDGDIAGHTIVRVEHDGQGERFGLFSTTYVDPAQRSQGIADQLLQHGEDWMRAQGLQRAATWTSATNAKLIKLYARHGYAEDQRGEHPQTGTVMVRLARLLQGHPAGEILDACPPP